MMQLTKREEKSCSDRPKSGRVRAVGAWAENFLPLSLRHLRGSHSPMSRCLPHNSLIFRCFFIDSHREAIKLLELKRGRQQALQISADDGRCRHASLPNHTLSARVFGLPGGKSVLSVCHPLRIQFPLSPSKPSRVPPQRRQFGRAHRPVEPIPGTQGNATSRVFCNHKCAASHPGRASIETPLTPRPTAEHDSRDRPPHHSRAILSLPPWQPKATPNSSVPGGSIPRLSRRARLRAALADYEPPSRGSVEWRRRLA